MSARAFHSADGLAWSTMTGLDVQMCMDYANAFSGTRGDAWLEAFEAKAVQLGYARMAGVDCTCGRICHADCGLVRRHAIEPVWPHDSLLGLINNERLPSPLNPFAVAPSDRVRAHQPEALYAPVPLDAVYSGEVALSDPDPVRAE